MPFVTLSTCSKLQGLRVLFLFHFHLSLFCSTGKTSDAILRTSRALCCPFIRTTFSLFFFKFQKAKALDLKRQTVDQASCYLSEKFDQLDNPADLYCRSFLVFVCSRRRTPPPLLGRWMAGGGACPDGRGLFLSLQRLVPT